MPAFMFRYCGLSRYFSNSAVQSASFNGGSEPPTRFHSVIESPESVSRVSPPITTITVISAKSAMSQPRTNRRAPPRDPASIIPVSRGVRAAAS